MLLHGKYQHIKEYLSTTQEEDFTVTRAVCPPWSRVTSAEMQGGQVEINRANTAIEIVVIQVPNFSFPLYHTQAPPPHPSPHQ
jgi:hypothetical protein